MPTPKSNLQVVLSRQGLPRKTARSWQRLIANTPLQTDLDRRRFGRIPGLVSIMQRYKARAMPGMSRLVCERSMCARQWIHGAGCAHAMLWSSKLKRTPCSCLPGCPAVYDIHKLLQSQPTSTDGYQGQCLRPCCKMRP